MPSLINNEGIFMKRYGQSKITICYPQNEGLGWRTNNNRDCSLYLIDNTA